MLCGVGGQKQWPDAEKHPRQTKEKHIGKDVAVWHPFANGERTVI